MNVKINIIKLIIILIKIINIKMSKFTSLYPLIGCVSSGIFMGTIFSFYKLNESIALRNIEPNNLKKFSK